MLLGREKDTLLLHINKWASAVKKSNDPPSILFCKKTTIDCSIFFFSSAKVILSILIPRVGWFFFLLQDVK